MAEAKSKKTVEYIAKGYLLQDGKVIKSGESVHGLTEEQAKRLLELDKIEVGGKAEE